MKKLSDKKNFLIITKDGMTFDNSGENIENCKILDFVKANSKDDILVNTNEYGDFTDYDIIEYEGNNFKTSQISFISDTLRHLIDKGLEDKTIHLHKQELLKLKKILNNITI